jgi:SAM-dependent methyltransferase
MTNDERPMANDHLDLHYAPEQSFPMDGLDTFKAAQKAAWVHFAPMQAITIAAAPRLVEHARIRPGTRVLDVGCGTGVAAITAAHAGAQVTGLDLTPELLAVARDNARTADVAVDWHEGDVESMPFATAAFDVVVSQFGHMFAPRPEVAIAEMLRVLKPGGTIAFSTWPPELLVGRTSALAARYAPPPAPGATPPSLWGDPQVICERLGPPAVRDIVFDRATISVPALSVGHFRELIERGAGPLVKLVESLRVTDPQKLAAFRREYDALTAEYYDRNIVRQDFLITRAVKV